MSDENFFSKLLTFDDMITPSIIKILYYIGCVLVILGGIFTLFQGGAATFIGLVWIVLGPIAVRIYCELLIVMFKIYQCLKEMNERGRM